MSVTPQSLARGIRHLSDEREISRRAQQHHLSGRVGNTTIFHERAALIRVGLLLFLNECSLKFHIFLNFNFLSSKRRPVKARWTELVGPSVLLRV